MAEEGAFDEGADAGLWFVGVELVEGFEVGAMSSGTVRSLSSKMSTYSTGGPLHAPTSAASNTYAYDNVGNRSAATVAGQTTNYSYDPTGRVLTTSGADSAAMLYDASGERVKRTVNAATGYYLASGIPTREESFPQSPNGTWDLVTLLTKQ